VLVFVFVFVFVLVVVVGCMWCASDCGCGVYVWGVVGCGVR